MQYIGAQVTKGVFSTIARISEHQWNNTNIIDSNGNDNDTNNLGWIVYVVPCLLFGAIFFLIYYNVQRYKRKKKLLKFKVENESDLKQQKVIRSNMDGTTAGAIRGATRGAIETQTLTAGKGSSLHANIISIVPSNENSNSNSQIEMNNINDTNNNNINNMLTDSENEIEDMYEPNASDLVTRGANSGGIGNMTTTQGNNGETVNQDLKLKDHMSMSASLQIEGAGGKQTQM